MTSSESFPHLFLPQRHTHLPFHASLSFPYYLLLSPFSLLPYFLSLPLFLLISTSFFSPFLILSNLDIHTDSCTASAPVSTGCVQAQYVSVRHPRSGRRPTHNRCSWMHKMEEEEEKYFSVRITSETRTFDLRSCNQYVFVETRETERYSWNNACCFLSVLDSTHFLQQINTTILSPLKHCNHRWAHTHYRSLTSLLMRGLTGLQKNLVSI